MTFEIEPTCSLRQESQQITQKAQTIFILGVMGYHRDPVPPGAILAMLSFGKLLAMAKRRGFKGSKQFKGAVRRGRATAFAMDIAQALAALVTDAEFQRELASLALWDSVGAPGNTGNRSSSQNTTS